MKNCDTCMNRGEWQRGNCAICVVESGHDIQSIRIVWKEDNGTFTGRNSKIIKRCPDYEHQDGWREERDVTLKRINFSK